MRIILSMKKSILLASILIASGVTLSANAQNSSSATNANAESMKTSSAWTNASAPTQTMHTSNLTQNLGEHAGSFYQKISMQQPQYETLASICSIQNLHAQMEPNGNVVFRGTLGAEDLMAVNGSMSSSSAKHTPYAFISRYVPVRSGFDRIKQIALGERASASDEFFGAFTSLQVTDNAGNKVFQGPTFAFFNKDKGVAVLQTSAISLSPKTGEIAVEGKLLNADAHITPALQANKAGYTAFGEKSMVVILPAKASSNIQINNQNGELNASVQGAKWKQVVDVLRSDEGVTTTIAFESSAKKH